MSRDQYAAKAKDDLNRQADRAIAFRQGTGEHAVFGNAKSGMAGWINTTNPARSTYFKPDLGVSKYLAGRERHLRNLGQSPRVIDLTQARASPNVTPLQTTPPARISSTAPKPNAKVSRTSAPALPPGQPGVKTSVTARGAASVPKTNAPAARPITVPKTAAPAPPAPRPAAPQPPGPGRPGGGRPGGPR